MALLTPEIVYRRYETMGVPESGPHEPKKAEIIQLLNALFGVSRGGWVVARTLAELNGITPESETDGGVVLTGAGAGYYDRDGGAWVFGRGFPDTFAKVALSGSGTAQTGAVNAGVNPASIEVFFAKVVTANTGALTLSISGEAPKPVVNLAGNPLSAGEWTGMVMFYLNDDDEYQLLIDAGAAAAAAASASAAQEWANNPEDDPVGTEAGGDGLTTFSARHWAQKAEDLVGGAVGATPVADRTALKALDVGAITTAIMKEAGRQGLFIFMAGDYSAQVTADTLEGIYVAPASDATGASGAWVRVYTDCWMLSWFGASTSRNDNQVCVAAALDLIGNGGRLFIDTIYPVNGPIVIGNGANGSASTKHHGICMFGKTFGSSADVSSVAQNIGSGFIWAGGASVGQAIIVFAGPLHSPQIYNLMLDGADLVGTGMYNNHVYQFDYQRILVKRVTYAAYQYTTRDAYFSGVSYGCGEGRQVSCYSYDPENRNVFGIRLDSGIPESEPISGNPDTCRIQFIGGTYFYGGDPLSHGAWLRGADNNKFYGTMFLPMGGSAGGYDIYLEQWPGEGLFPHENVFEIYGTRGIGGNGGVGSAGYNTVVAFQEGDGAIIPSLPNMQVVTQKGNEYVGGKRVYRSRQPGSLVDGTVRTTSSTSFSDIPAYSLTLEVKPNSRIRVSGTISAAKNTDGSGTIQLVVDGTAVTQSSADVPATGYHQMIPFHHVTGALSAGNHTVKFQFKSSNANVFQVRYCNLIVEELS